MRVSLSWLKDYVDITLPAGELAHRLTMAGLEVETVEDRFDYLDKVVVGRITAVAPHPNADKLTVCRVDTGGQSYSVVCGAPNAAEGLVAPLALPGCELIDGVQIGESTIRGQVSHGMLCSAGELGLDTDRSGLMGLDAALKPGTPLNRALNLSDPVFEIGLTPNRPDCLSILGIAREIAAFAGIFIRKPEIELPETSGDIATQTSVTIEAPEHCPRYAARLLSGITVAPSPFWLQDRLRSVGLRPINNLVDITNFVMMETGQPLHAFDFDNLEENRIVVSTASEGEAFTTLDGKERRMQGDMLMICDGRKPVGIAGVMGGLNSEIEDGTTRVLLESAYFDPISIRRTAKRLGLNTDASHRFERGVDPHGTLYALDRAARLMAEMGGGQMIGGTIDESYELPAPCRLDLSVAATNRLLGTGLDAGQIGNYLRSIEFEVTEKGGDTLQVQAPSFRVDVSRPQDLMEEVARCHGYDNIPVSHPAIPSTGSKLTRLQTQRRRIRSRMTGLGFAESVNYSFIHPASADRLQLPMDDERRRAVTILNPLTEDQAVMRTSLLPGLLEAAQRNIARQARTLKLYEIGKTFLGAEEDQLPRELEIMAGLWTGERTASGWFAKSEPCDFYDLKGTLEALLLSLNVSTAQYSSMPDADCHYTRPGATARILVNGAQIGLVGELHPKVCAAYDLKQPVFIFEIELDQLLLHVPDAIQAQPVPRFPATSRDVTLIIEKQLETQAILDDIRQLREPLVEQVKLFDLFEGRPIPQGRKSVSLRITYRSQETTLEDDAVNQLHKRITDGLVATFKADLPA